MTQIIKAQPGIMQIAPYVSGKAAVSGVKNALKLSANENPYGVSPMARAAYLAQADQLNIYPSTDHADLIEALADEHGLDARRIICGCGSDELLNLFCYAFVGLGDEVIFTEYGFSVYRIATLAAGATPVVVPESERHTDTDAIKAALTPHTKLVFIANPNNPTGTMISLDALEDLAKSLPKGCLLVIDSAYAEFVQNYDGGAALVEKYDNIAMTRTFSKLYGLGGLRIGWAYVPPEVWDVLNRIRPPFNLSNAGIAAAKAALKDDTFITAYIKANAIWRDYLISALRDLGLGCDESHANFVLACFKDKTRADRAFKILAQNGLIMRQVGGYNLPNCLRITVGQADACEKIITILKDNAGQVL